MGTLLGTYAAAALVVGVYAGWLVIGTRRLSRRLKQLESRVEKCAGQHEPAYEIIQRCGLGDAVVPWCDLGTRDVSVLVYPAFAVR